MQVRTIFAMAWPILLAMFAQSAFTLVELALVGQLGKEATSALGLGAFYFTGIFAVLVGISVGVQGYAAEFSGNGNVEALDEVLQAGLVCSLIGGLAIMLISIASARPVFSLLASNPVTASDAASYLVVRAVSLPALAANGAFRGYFKGVGRPWVYTLTLVAMLLFNGLLDWLFIFGNLGLPRLGLTGAALGFTAAAWVGIAVYFFIWLRSLEQVKQRLRISAEMVRAVVSRSVPAAIQQLIGVLSFPTLLFFMAQIDADALAAGTILLNITFAVILVGQAFGFASATFVGERFGSGDNVIAKRISLKVSGVAAIVAMIFALPLAIAPDFALAVFTTDPVVIEAARLSAWLIALAVPIDAFGMVIMQTMLGVGQGKKVVILSLILQWAIAMPASFCLGVLLEYGMLGIWVPQIIARILQSALIGMHWFAQTPASRLIAS